MFEIVLYQPEIPQNTGNIMRLAVNTGCKLHLVRPLGFVLQDRLLRRAGLDYKDRAVITEYEDWTSLKTAFTKKRLLTFSTRAKRHYTDVSYKPGDALIFGPETRGLPNELLENFTIGFTKSVRFGLASIIVIG